MAIIKVIPKVTDRWMGVSRFKKCGDDLAPYFKTNGGIYTSNMTSGMRKSLGEKLGLDLSTGSSYWRDFFVRFTDKPLILNTNDPAQELIYLFLKDHKDVCDKTANQVPGANTQYIMIDDEAEAKKSASVYKEEIEALRVFESMTNMQKVKCLRLYGESAINTDQDVVYAKLFEKVKADPSKFMENWVNNQSRDVEWLIKECVSKRIIKKTKEGYSYGAMKLGFSLPSAIEFLNDPQNADLKSQLLQDSEK